MNESAVLCIQTCIQILTPTLTVKCLSFPIFTPHWVPVKLKRDTVCKALISSWSEAMEGPLAGLSSPALGTGGWRGPRGPGPGRVRILFVSAQAQVASRWASPRLERRACPRCFLPARSPSSVNPSFVHVKSYIPSFLPQPPPFLPSPTATALVSSAPSCFQLEAPPADPAG